MSAVIIDRDNQQLAITHKPFDLLCILLIIQLFFSQFLNDKKSDSYKNDENSLVSQQMNELD